MEWFERTVRRNAENGAIAFGARTRGPVERAVYIGQRRDRRCAAGSAKRKTVQHFFGAGLRDAEDRASVIRHASTAGRAVKRSIDVDESGLRLYAIAGRSAEAV